MAELHIYGRTADSLMMNLVQRVIGDLVTDPNDPHNLYIPFFLRHVGFGPHKVLVDEILDLRCNHKELAAVIAWMEHRARTEAKPTRDDIEMAKIHYKRVDYEVRKLSQILDLPVAERWAAVHKINAHSHDAMNTAMVINFGIPKKDQVDQIRFEAVLDPTDPDVLLKVFACELCKHLQCGAPGFIFFKSPREEGNGEDFFELYGRLSSLALEPKTRRGAKTRGNLEEIMNIMNLVYDVRQAVVEFAAIMTEMAIAIDLKCGDILRMRYELRKRKEIYKEIVQILQAMLAAFRADLRREDDPRLDCPAIQRRLNEIMRLTVDACYPIHHRQILRGLAFPYLGVCCAGCKAPSSATTRPLHGCSRCKDETVKYCCKECQTSDWPKHKLACRPPTPPKPENAKKGGGEPQCANCAVTLSMDADVWLRPCPKCKLVDYCGKACQTQHWKEGKHKQFCVAKEARRPGAQEAPVAGPACPVCLDALDGKAKATLRCGHALHQECEANLKALSILQGCPVCRASFASSP